MSNPYNLDEFYTAEFFAANQAEGLKHAEWFVPLLKRLFDPKWMIDVGCGTGHFVLKAHFLGINCVGVDGAHEALEKSVSMGLVRHDLRIPLRPAIRYDLALCIEVAEHLEPEYADTLVETLCNCSDMVVMTAATPGQGGLQHVNEQPLDYWSDKFAFRGYVLTVWRTRLLRNGVLEAAQSDHHVAPWFHKVVCFERSTPSV